MTIGPSQLHAGQTLAAALEERGPFGAIPALTLVRHLAAQVSEIHAAGMIHGGIALKTIRLDDSGLPRLEMPVAETPPDVGSDSAGLFPDLSRLPPVKLPVNIDSLRRQLEAAGTPLDPRQIDLFGLGAAWCRLLTGESVGAYLRSPRVKGRFPARQRLTLERMLNVNGREKFNDADELLAELDSLAAGIPELEAAAAPDAGSPATGPGPADPPASKTGDTTPSFLSSNDPVADTTVVTPVGGPVAESHAESSPAGSGARDRNSDALPFAWLGHYEIIGRLGKGGMGEVYLGYERALDRQVAVKVLPADLAHNGEFVRRFKAEASAAARLIHPHVVQIFLIGEDGGHHYFSMQYVAGESLAGLLHRRQKLAVDETLSLVEQVLAGLNAAHKMGLVHRDIKPGNILLDREQGRALLGDFGLVKLLESSSATGHTATGVVMGTVDYISPEQGRGKAVDGRSDLYSMGVLIYQLLSGRLPFEADNPTALIFQHVYEPPPPLTGIAPHVPAPLAAVVEKLLAKSPADRYQDIDELLRDLQAVRTGAALPSGADRPKSSPAQPRERPSLVIQAPRLEDEIELPPALHGDLQPLGFWEAAQGRALSLFRRHAPEVIQQLQNTQQQLDGAVAEYARRERKLAQLVREAEVVLGELVSQAAAQRSAAREANARGRDVSESDAIHAAQADELACTQAAQELERQAAEQEDELGQMRLRLAQASARLQELRNQRDILQARFKAAGAQKLISGGARSRTQVITAKTVIAGLTILAVVTAVYLYSDSRQKTGGESGPSKGTALSDSSNGGLEAKTKRTTTENRPLPPEMTALPLRQLNFVRDARWAAFDPRAEQLFTLSETGSLEQIRLPWWLTAPPRLELGDFDRKSTLSAAAFSSDGKLMAAATNPTKDVKSVLRVWQTASGRRLRELAAMANPIRAVAFRPDAAVLAAVTTNASGRGSVAFWSVSGDNATETSRIDDVDARSIVYSPAGDLLAIAGNDRHVYLWDVPNSKIACKLDDLASPISAMSFCPGRNLVMAGDESGAVTMWDTSSGQRLGRFDDQRKIPRSDQAISALAVSPDGKWLASADVERICIWDVRLGSLRKVYEQKDTSVLLFKPDSSVLVSAGPQGPILVWNVDFEVTPTVYPTSGSASSLITAQMPPVSSRLIPLDDNSVLFGAGPQVHKYDRNLNAATQRLAGHKGNVRAVALSRGEGLYFSGSEDGTVRTWNAKTGESIASLEVRLEPDQPVEPVLSLAATTDGARLLVGTDRSVFVWQRLPESKLERIGASPGSSLSVAWSPDESRALAAGFSALNGQGLVRILDVTRKRELHCIEGRTGAVADALFTGAGSQCLYVDKAAAHWCGIYDAAETRAISLPDAGMASNIGQSVDRKYLSLGLGAALSIRDAQSVRELLRCAGDHEQGQVLQSEFTPSGRYIVVLRAGNRLSWQDIFPARAMTRAIVGPVLSGDYWYNSDSDDRERAWQQLELDRPAAVHFQGPADVPALADFRADGGWSIVAGQLEREPGATRAAIDLGQLPEMDATLKVKLDRTGVFFILLGWNGQRGYLLCKSPDGDGATWSLYASQTGDFQGSSRASLGRSEARDTTTMKLELRRSKFRLGFEDHAPWDWHQLPDYEPGHVVLGVVDGGRGDTVLKIDSIQVKTVVN